MRLRAFLSLLLMLALASRPLAAVEPAETVASARPTGRLILKLRAGADTCLSCAMARGARLGALQPGSRLDALNRRFHVRVARPLLRHGLVPGDTPLLRQQRLARRFPTRQARAPRGAQLADMGRTYLLEVGRRRDLAAVARAYTADPAVEYCEPDTIVRIALAPNDPYFASTGSWGQDFDDLWALKTIAAPTAWDTTAGAGVVVAVVDTGVDYTHPDLAANMWANPGEIPGNGIDDDGNGYVDDVRGWDFAYDDADPMDDHLHGTHVAGTIAAVGNNGAGVVGVAFQSHVMAVKGLDAAGFGAVSNLAQAIIYAVDNGADVINASWGGSGQSATISDAIRYAHAAGTMFVAAAGNDTGDTADFFPANDPNAIAVAAFTHLDTPASFTNFGIKLDVAAPGGGDGPPPADSRLPRDSVLSLLSSAVTLQGNLRLLQVGTRYLRLAGTSMAAPHVTGTAALVLAAHPSFSVEQVRQVLRASADDLAPPGPDLATGYGRLNAARAVATAEPLVAQVTSPTAGTLLGAGVVSVTGSATGPGFVSYTVEYGPAPTPAAWTPIAGPVTTPVADGVLASWNVDDVLDGNYVLRLRVERASENFIDRVPVTMRSLAIDEPAPMAALRAEGSVEIRGTAAGAGFTSYRVEYRRPAIDPALWRTDGVTLAVPPGTRVRDGLLATLDIAGLTAGDRFDFRLTVENGSGTEVKTRSGIVIDPTLRAGWPQQIVPVADYQYLTVIDLDSDGVKEILVGSGNEVVVFEPDGSVRPGWPESVATIGHPAVDTLGSPLVADVTGDGAPEVITTNRYELLVWSRDGVLLPGFPRVVDVFGGGNAWLTAGDLDGDGKDEILCSAAMETQAFFGDGREVPGWNRFAELSDSALTAADVLGDSRVEVAMYNRSFKLDVPGHTLGLHRSDRSTLPGWPLHVTAGLYFPRIGMADMDGDRRLDVVVIGESETRRVSPSAFTALGKRLRLGKVSSRTLCRTPGAICYPYTNNLLSYADLDRDGRAEAYLYMRVPHGTNQVNGFGQFQAIRLRDRVARPTPLVHQFFQSRLESAATAIGDIDGDGVQELVNGTMGDDPFGRRRLAVVVAHADGTLHPQFPKPVPQFVAEDGDPFEGFGGGGFHYDDDRYATPAIADLDGDGLKEVVWVDPITFEIFVWNVAGTPGPELADWPMYHHDPKHTNVLPVQR